MCKKQTVQKKESLLGSTRTRLSSALVVVTAMMTRVGKHPNLASKRAKNKQFGSSRDDRRRRVSPAFVFHEQARRKPNNRNRKTGNEKPKIESRNRKVEHGKPNTQNRTRKTEHGTPKTKVPKRVLPRSSPMPSDDHVVVRFETCPQVTVFAGMDTADRTPKSENKGAKEDCSAVFFNG